MGQLYCMTKEYEGYSLTTNLLSARRVALVHDWLVTDRGGERVLEAMAELFPKAPIFTLFYDKLGFPPGHWTERRDIRVPAMLQKLHRVRKPLVLAHPNVVRQIDLRDFDFILSSSSCLVKSVTVPRGAKHVCYIHSPMRYIYDQQEEYFAALKSVPLLPHAARLWAAKLRRWDQTHNDGVTQFVANSRFIAERVKNFYRRDAVVVHPPVEVERFRGDGGKNPNRQDYYVAAGAFVPYKRLDLAVLACRQLQRRLIVAGSGPEEDHLRRLAGGDPLIEFRIAPPRADFIEVIRNAKALLYPGVEDFGIMPVEGLAGGTPVIALQAGGALDYVISGKNGVFFPEATAESLVAGMRSFEASSFDEAEVQRSADAFTKAHFQRGLLAVIEKVCEP